MFEELEFHCGYTCNLTLQWLLKKKKENFGQFLGKKCQVFGNFLTVKCQFSRESAGHSFCSHISQLLHSDSEPAPIHSQLSSPDW